MTAHRVSDIVIRGAREHNLQGFDLSLPQGSLTVITGVSGSGKSSLAFDTLFREGQRRFLETLPAFARQFAGGFRRPAVTAIRGLGPAVAVGQGHGQSNPRSTVGTLTEVWDMLRLLFARLGHGGPGVQPTRGLFSFNGPDGACPRCQGLGVEDGLDLDLLVADPAKTLREGALRVSTPNGYLMYSQVTLEVLDEVLRAHGGSVDLPWQDLAEEVRQVVFYGSERLKVPYGKHPLASRLQWTGITARPRQEGFYRGLVPVMEEILRGKRNDSILRFVRTAVCTACGGARLRPEALAVRWQGRRIDALGAMTASQLRRHLGEVIPAAQEAPVFEPIRGELLARCALMEELGLGYLTFDRGAPTLSLGESQRLRLLGLALGELQGLLVVLDEPSAGLHPHDVGRLVRVLRRLRDQGQTVVVVEHDPIIARAADWLVELGPGPGALGGRVLFSGPPSQRPAPAAAQPSPGVRKAREGSGSLRLEGLRRHNLQGLQVDLKREALNVVTGVSGAGKTSLLEEVVERQQGPGSPFSRTVSVSADPIGRTPRSNAATYSGAFELIRNLFAATPEAKAAGLGKGHFTFNTAGGRCEACEGAGVIEVGMRHLGTVTMVCEACQGRRFHEDVLKILYRGQSIAGVLEGSIEAAAAHFHDQPALARILGALVDCGLGYLPLGQPATTLSGGEAQRVKLATELARAGHEPALIALDEPTVGLHSADVAVLLGAWDRLIEAGHTLLVVDNDQDVVRAADHLIDLGPGSGPEGGRVVVSGSLEALVACAASLTGACLGVREEPPGEAPSCHANQPMVLTGITTHNLKHLDVAIPAQGLTVVTGPSGCGKSSLVFDTLLAEAQNRFADLVAPWARRLLPRRGGAELVSARGLRATVAVPQRPGRRNPRSRVGTVTGVDELLRLLFARAGTRPAPAGGDPLPVLWASSFSPNTQAGGCPGCKGLGFLQACDPALLVTHPDRALGAGAMAGTAYGAYLGEPQGQFLATLQTAAQALGLDCSGPWKDLGAREQALAMHGAGERIFEVAWHYRRGTTEGTHLLTTPWAGLATLVDREYERVHLDPRGEALEALLAERPCPLCGGERLAPAARAVQYGGLRLPEVTAMPVAQLGAWLKLLHPEPMTATLRRELQVRLEALGNAGLGYLALDRDLASLSGGEAQRVRLAAALEGGLSGVAYVLDEPTQGLHPRDRLRLAGVLRGLVEAGNAVVVVEHDPLLIARADLILELGPGAGPDGGRLLASGSPAALKANPDSRAGRLLSRLDAPRTPRPGRPGVTLRGVNLRNLKHLEVAFPLGALVAVTGVSGSGKSTLVREVLGASLQARLQGRAPVGCAGLELHEPLGEVLALGQAPPGAGGASTVATLCGVGEILRKRLAATPRAKALKLTARHFSTAVPGGRCEACEGRGILTVALDLLPDVTVGCEACLGQRFLPPVLECRLGGLNIAQMLEATLEEALLALAGDGAVAAPLQALVDTGLGYLRLGQEARTLSEGEGQRLRLAGLLATAPAGPVAILLDEPTRGLGDENVARLLAVLGRLVEAGHLVVAVEHELGFIAAADWILDLGPEGGPDGGALVAAGPPAAIRACAASHTGLALKG